MPIFRFHKDVEDVPALFASRIERVRRPIEDQQTCGSHRASAIFCDHADIFVFLDHALQPRSAGPVHFLQNRTVIPAHGTATNAMCMLLAINTSSVQLIPVTAIAILAANHSSNPTAIVDRKSTRLNSSHLGISYAVFCLK